METGTIETSSRKWIAPFFTIWGGQAFSLLGSQLVQFALVWWLTKTTGSATILATATLVALLPQIVVMPLAGALIDRWNRRLVMILADGLVALASLWLAFMFWRGSVQIWHIYLIMTVRAIGGAFHWPAMQASTTLMVPEKHLGRVAGMNQTLFGVLGIFGPPLGALAMETMPLFGIMLIDVGTALMAIVPLLFIPIPQPPRPAQAEGEPQAAQPSLWADMHAGLRYVLGWRGLVLLIGMALIFKLALTPAFTLFALLVRQHFNGDAVQYGMVETLLGLGTVIGGVILSAWGGFKNRVYTALLGLLFAGIFFGAIGFTPGNAFWLLLTFVFLVGFTLPFVDGSFMAIMQSSIAPEMQGRAFTLVGSLLTLSSPVGLALAGPVSDRLGLQVWYIAAGVLTTLCAVGMLLMPDVVNIEHQGNAAGPVQPDILQEASAATPGVAD
jgi:DHA3 family macrolide efflux protein-like MFS transporter